MFDVRVYMCREPVLWGALWCQSKVGIFSFFRNQPTVDHSLERLKLNM